MCYTPVFGIVVTLTDFLKYFGHCYPFKGDKLVKVINPAENDPNKNYPGEYHLFFDKKPKIINSTEIPFGIMYNNSDGSELKIGVICANNENSALNDFNNRLNNCSDKELWISLFNGQQPQLLNEF